MQEYYMVLALIMDISSLIITMKYKYYLVFFFATFLAFDLPTVAGATGSSGSTSTYPVSTGTSLSLPSNQDGQGASLTSSSVFLRLTLPTSSLDFSLFWLFSSILTQTGQFKIRQVFFFANP